MRERRFWGLEIATARFAKTSVTIGFVPSPIVDDYISRPVL
jgi:hypothetical protein